MASSATWVHDDPSLSNIVPAQHHQRRQMHHQQQQQQHPPRTHSQQSSVNMMSPEVGESGYDEDDDGYGRQQQQHQHHSSMMPGLADLLDVVGTESRIDRPLFNLLSGIVAAVEVNNDRVTELSSQYRELSFEVATISRVLSSNQLSSTDKKSNKTESSSQKPSATADNINSKATNNVSRRQTGGNTSSVNTTTTAGRSSQHHNRTTAADEALAAESVAALHNHAVTELEARMDGLAVRIGRLQEEVSARTRDAMEQTVRDVSEACDAERDKTVETLRDAARTVEGQLVVRINDVFSERELRLVKTAEEAYDGLTQCGEDLAQSLSRAGKAFVESTTSATTATIAAATTAAAEVVMDAREAVAEHAHSVIASNFELESKSLWLFQRAEKMFTELLKQQSGGCSVPSSPPPNNNNSTTISAPPLPFRCCSAVEEVRALYSLFGIDGADALRIFRNFVERPSLMSGSGGGSANTNNNSTAVLSRKTVESLQVILRSPAFRCLQEPLPALGMQVADAPPPTEGAEVVFLDPNGRAAQAGLRIGDVIMRVGGIDVGSGGASKGALHLALILAPGRPFATAVRAILAPDTTPSSASSQTTTPATAAPPQSASSSSARWAPDLPPQDVSVRQTEFGSRRAMIVASADMGVSSATSRSMAAKKRPDHGAVLTVYRYRDALTFSCRINLDVL